MRRSGGGVLAAGGYPRPRAGNLGAAPSRSIDTAPLLASLDGLRQACDENREIKILLDAASVTAAWRTLERSVEQVVSELRPVEE